MMSLYIPRHIKRFSHRKSNNLSRSHDNLANESQILYIFIIMMNLHNDPNESLEAARELAADIMKAGQSLDNGEGLPEIELDIFEIDLTHLLFLLKAGGFDTADAVAHKKPTQKQVDKVSETLGPDCPRFDELYEAGQKIRAYICKKAWGIMQEKEFEPDDEMPYLSFHARLEEMGIDPQSDDVLDFLGGITREEFERVDHPHALNAIYVDFRTSVSPLLGIEILARLQNRERNSDVSIDMRVEFNKGKEQVLKCKEQDMVRTIRQSHLSEQQVVDYLAFRDNRIAEHAKTNPLPKGIIPPHEGPKGVQ